MIKFRKLRYMNILSTGNTFTEIDLAKDKATLIVGTNGVGKSTFIDALTFVLYGRAFRAINKPQLINTITGKNLLVEVDFTIGKSDYMVRRGIKPNIFEIYQNGKQLNQQAGARDDQEYLEKTILKLNFKSFSQIVVLGNANYTPFMQLPAAQRRSVVEDLLDIQVFSVMNTLLKEKALLNKEDAKDTEYEIGLCQSKIALHEKHIQQLKANNEELIADKAAKIEEHENAIEQHKTTVNALVEQVDALSVQTEDFERVSARKQKLIQIESSLEDRVRKLKKEVEFFHDNENCPTCKQGIDHYFRSTTITQRTDKLNEVNNALVQLEADVANTKQRLDDIQKINKQILELNNRIQQNNQQIKFLNRYISDTNDEIESLKKSVSKVALDDEDFVAAKRALESLNGKKKNLTEERAMFEVASHLLRDSGIKTKIIKQFIPVMNKLINKYLALMDFMCDFHLDESFNETIRSRYRDVFSINSFSEGEKMRLNIAIMLAWRAIAKIRNSAAVNLLIMDEVLDSSLDGNAHDSVISMIEESGEDQNIFIISHRAETAERFENVITFEKHGNFSRIAQ